MRAARPAVDPGFMASVQLATRMMQREIMQLRQTVTRHKDEFENLRRRHDREKDQVVSTASESVITRLLPIVDNFERALASEAVTQGHPSVREGLELVLRQVEELFAAEGVTRIKALNCPFDPNVHDAVSTVVTSSVPDHHVAQVVLGGYRMKDRVIRPAAVIVASAPADGRR